VTTVLHANNVGIAVFLGPRAAYDPILPPPDILEEIQLPALTSVSVKSAAYIVGRRRQSYGSSDK